MVERYLAKVEVEGSSPFYWSMKWFFLILLFISCNFRPEVYYHRKHYYTVLDTIRKDNGLLIRHKCDVRECNKIDSFMLLKGYKYK